jgi:molybdopterin-containing oxidoreductase family membrane subunit
MITFNAFIPQLLWIPRIRRNLNAFFLIAMFVNIGMWWERFVIIVPSLAHSYEPWKFMNYHLTWVEASILLGSFGWFFMWFLLFLRYLPGLSIAEIKEVLPPPMRDAHGDAHAANVDASGTQVEHYPTGYYA